MYISRHCALCYQVPVGGAVPASTAFASFSFLPSPSEDIEEGAKKDGGSAGLGWSEEEAADYM